MAMFNSYVSLPEGTTNDIKNSHHQWKGSLFWSWWWLRNLRIRTYNSHHQWHKRMRTNSHHHQLSLSPCVKTEAARYQNYDINMGWFVGSQEKTMAAMAIGLRFAHQKREKKNIEGTCTTLFKCFNLHELPMFGSHLPDMVWQLVPLPLFVKKFRVQMAINWVRILDISPVSWTNQLSPREHSAKSSSKWEYIWNCHVSSGFL